MDKQRQARTSAQHCLLHHHLSSDVCIDASVRQLKIRKLGQLCAAISCRCRCSL
jgi:hypothetical protein